MMSRESIAAGSGFSSSELPLALAAAISSQNRNFWGVCAVRRPTRFARLHYLINDTVTIGSAPFADVPLPHLSSIHAVIRRNPVEGSLGVANASASGSAPIVAECDGFRVTVQPVESIGFPSSGTLHIPACPPPGSPPEEDLVLEIYAAPKRELVVSSPPVADSGQVDVRVFGSICDPSIRLKDMLTCQVCHELLFDAVTVSPCCHHFCAPCLSQWLDSDNANAHSCPVCRVILSAATPDPLIRSISAAYAQVEPAHARAPDEIRQLQQVDTGSIARVGERRRHAGQDDGESDDDNDNGSFDEQMASWDGHGGGLDSSGMIRGPDAFALDIHAPFRAPTFGGEDGNQPMRRTLQRWSELFSVDVDALDQLEEISVNSYLSDVWMSYIASFIACKISDKLQYIHLPDCGLGSAAAPLLGEALCLHFDRVAQSRLAEPSGVESSQDEGHVRGVLELYVDSNFLRDHGCLALLAAPLRHPACTLRAISISSIGLRDAGFMNLAASLAVNSTVNELNIRHNPLGDDSIQLLCDIMKGERCALSCLEIGSNAFGSRGLAALGKSLEFATSLKTLAISSVCSDGEGADCSCWEAWAAGLRVNQTLRHIILHSCSISAVSCSVLCVGLEANSTLTRLVLDYNSIGDEGCDSLSRVMYSAAMRRVPDRNDATSEPQIWGLQEVSVVANGIGERGGALLLRSLVAGGCKLLLDGIGWVIASEVESLDVDDPNFSDLRAADSILNMTLEHVAASIGQQRAAFGATLPSLPEISSAHHLSAASFAFAISSHVPPAHAPFVSLLAFVIPRPSGALDTEALRHELLQKLPGHIFHCDSLSVKAVLQRDVALYATFVEQFKALVARADTEAAQVLVQQTGSDSLDNCVQRISSALVRLGVSTSEKIFYGLPLSVTFCRNGSPESVSYFKEGPSFDRPDHPDHWCIVDDSSAQIFVAWRQDAAYFFVQGLGGSSDCDGFSSSLAALRLAIGSISMISSGEGAAPGREIAVPFIDIIATFRVDWPGQGHDVGNRMRNESRNDVVLVALSHNQAGSLIMVNPNPLQWGRAAAITTFDLGSMTQPAPNPWTCTNGHALWPVLLMPDERYSGGWACDACDSHLPFFCSAPVLHCEICKFDLCCECQVKYTPVEALEAVAAHDESGWDDVDEDEDIFGEGSEDDDDDHDSTTEPLTSSEIEGSDDGHSEGHDEESSADDSDDDGHSGDGSQGTYGRVSHIFFDASFNQLGTSVQRALHAAPMFSRCVRAFHLASVSRPSVAPFAQSIPQVAASSDAL